MPVLPITIYHKHAVYTGKIPYVCSNSDYEVVFTFDAEWEGHTEKTVRFCAGDQCVDRIMTGNTCPVPVLESGSILQIGVYAGNLQTSTAALVRMCDSIRSIGGTPAEPEPSVYDQIMERLNESGKGKYIASYRIISDLDTNTHTLELKYNDGDVLSVKLPKMGIDIDRVVKFGTEDPTGETIGQTKQLYVNTATGRMWVCENGNMMPMHWIGLSGAGSTDSEIEVPGLGSGGVSLGMTGAAVGQIAKITEVNESGVPTGWEPVDLPGTWKVISVGEITEDVGTIEFTDIGQYTEYRFVGDFAAAANNDGGMTFKINGTAVAQQYNSYFMHHTRSVNETEFRLDRENGMFWGHSWTRQRGSVHNTWSATLFGQTFTKEINSFSFTLAANIYFKAGTKYTLYAR